MLPLVLSLPALWAIPHFAKSSLSSSYRRVPSRILTCCAKSSEASDQISRVTAHKDLDEQIVGTS
jgi:hypothetical protein